MSAGYNYKECSRTEAMYKYLILLKTAQEVSTGTSEDDFGVPNQTHSEGNNFAVSSESYELIRKRNASSDQLITDGTDYPEQSRSKIYIMNEKVFSTSSGQDGIKSDFRMDLNSTNQNVLERKCLTDMNHGLTRFEESHSHNYGNQSLDISSIKKTFPTDQLTASNVNFPKNIRSSNKHSDSGSFDETASFIATNLSFPGPYQTFENIPQSNLRLENYKYGSPLKPQTAIGSEKVYLMCRGCNMEVSTQVKEITGWKRLKYCDCRYWCAVCGVGYYTEGSHEIEHTCNVCQKTFPCKSLLEIHYFSHEKHHDIYCRLCQKKLVEHISYDKNYCCCICPYKDESKCHIKAHLYKHSNLQLFKCTQCVKQYKSKRGFFDHIKNHKV